MIQSCARALAVRAALTIADGPSCVVRWTFIYSTTSWVNAEHLQRPGPAAAKLVCVYTLGRLGEGRTTGGMRPPGARLPITNPLAVPLKILESGDKSITFAYGPHHPDAVSLLEALLNLPFLFLRSRGSGVQLRLDPAVALRRGCQW